jgi:hypothetical protein
MKYDFKDRMITTEVPIVGVLEIAEIQSLLLSSAIRIHGIFPALISFGGQFYNEYGNESKIC